MLLLSLALPWPFSFLIQALTTLPSLLLPPVIVFSAVQVFFICVLLWRVEPELVPWKARFSFKQAPTSLRLLDGDLQIQCQHFDLQFQL